MTIQDFFCYQKTFYHKKIPYDHPGPLKWSIWPQTDFFPILPYFEAFEEQKLELFVFSSYNT